MPNAIRFEVTGDPSVLRLESVPLAAPGPGEAVVRHHAIGVNFIDCYHRRGLYPVALPSGLGLEGAGIVEAVGPGVAEVKPGDRVAYAGGTLGAYSDVRLMKSERLVVLPEHVSFDIAAASLLKGMTVEYLICRTFPVRAGQTVLWHAAAGGVGLLACQWLRSLGVHVIGTVGSREKVNVAKAHGCSEVILSREENVAARVRELTEGQGVPVVFDSVGKDTLASSLDCLAPRGMLVSFGNASGKPGPLDLGELGAKGSLFVTRPALGTYTATRAELVGCANAFFAMLKFGSVRVEITERFALSDAASAHLRLESRSTTGSLILKP